MKGGGDGRRRFWPARLHAGRAALRERVLVCGNLLVVGFTAAAFAAGRGAGGGLGRPCADSDVVPRAARGAVGRHDGLRGW